MKTITTLAVLLIASAAQAQLIYSNIVTNVPAIEYPGMSNLALYIDLLPNHPASSFSFTFQENDVLPIRINGYGLGTIDNPVEYSLTDSLTGQSIAHFTGSSGVFEFFNVTYTPQVGQSFDLQAINTGGANQLTVLMLVPEPSGAWLAMIGVALFGIRGRVKRQAGCRSSILAQMDEGFLQR